MLIRQTTAMRHSIFYFSSFSMFLQSRISKSVVISSFCSFLCSFLFSIFFILFFSTLLSIPCSIFSLCLFTLFSDPLLFSFQNCYPFFSLFLLLYSVCFSLILYYYSICSLSISLHLFRSLYLILFCYLFCSCFCFLYTSSFWWGSMTLPVLCFSLPFSLFSFPIFSFCSFYASFLLFFLFFHFFNSLRSSLIYATPSCSYYWLTDFSRLCLFTYLFIYLFIITIIFLVLYFVCIALLLLPTD